MGRRPKGFDRTAWGRSRERQRERPLQPAPNPSTSGSGQAGSSRDRASNGDDPSGSQTPTLHDAPQALSRPQTTTPNTSARQRPPTEDLGADNAQVRHQDRDLASQSPPRRVLPSLPHPEFRGTLPAAIPESEDSLISSLMNPDDAGPDVADTFGNIRSYTTPALPNDDPGLQHQVLNLADPQMGQEISVGNAFPLGILSGDYGYVNLELPPHDDPVGPFCPICWNHAQFRTSLGL